MLTGYLVSLALSWDSCVQFTWVNWALVLAKSAVEVKYGSQHFTSNASKVKVTVIVDPRLGHTVEWCLQPS